MSLSAAKSRVMQAKMYLESKRFDELESTLAAAEKFLADVSPEDKAPVMAELAAIRATLATMPTPREEINLAGARGKVRQARSQIDSKQTLGIDDTLRSAEKFLEGIADKHVALIVADIAAIRAELAAAPPEPSRPAAVVAAPQPSPPKMMVMSSALPVAVAAVPATPAPAGPAALSDDDRANLSRAKNRVMLARSILEARSTENVETTLEQATGFLATVPGHAKAALLADIEAVRVELATTARAEEVRRVEARLEKDLRYGDTNVVSSLAQCRQSLNSAGAYLGSDEVKAVLSPERIEEFANRGRALEAQLSAAIKLNPKR